MKAVVNIVQLCVIAVIFSPAYYLWDRDQVDHFCEELKIGMTKQSMINLASEYFITLDGPVNKSIEGGKWQALVSPSISSDHTCEIKGIGSKVLNIDLAYY